MNGEILEEGPDFIIVQLDVAQWMNLSDQFIEEADVAIDDEKWRIHKSDADPFPSNPHAHYISGYSWVANCT